jgi:tRNA threonylcarbamoyl adenosine modification protein YeaZ
MNILAIETSSKVGSLSLRKSTEELNWVGNREISRSADLLPNIKKILGQGFLKKSQLDLIAVSNGPGSFTGLRVGISVARGLAFSLGVECVGISILEAIAVSVSFETETEIEVTSIVALAQKTWCRQDFKVFKGLARAQTGIILNETKEMFEIIEKNPERLFLADLETFQRIFAGPDQTRINTRLKNIGSVNQNLATWVGLLAYRRFQEGKPVLDVLPEYLL